MNFYTLTYDADLPAVQQVNVPTNTDYKVGMKVKRNGNVQSIKPSEFTIYTGEVNVIPPTEWGGTSISAETQSSSLNFIADKDDACAALAGQTIKAKDFCLEASYDNGTTWHKLTAQNQTIAQLTLNDRATGKNNSIARLDFNEGNSVWYIKNSDPQWSETVEELQMPERMGVAINTIGSNWNIASYPCLVRIGCSWGGSEQKVTYPVDQEKTNGYVTITKASGDSASFKQYGVHIDHGYDFNDYVKQTGVMTDTSKYDFPDTLTVESLGIGGQVLTMDNISWGYKKQAGTPVDVDDITTWYNSATYPAVLNAFLWPNGNTAVRITRAQGIILFDENGYLIGDGLDKVVLNPVWRLSFNGGVKGTAGNYYVIAYDFQLGTPFSADFKLNINEFKSQSGDIAETLADGSSVKVDGTYADGTTFSFDFCTK